MKDWKAPLKMPAKIYNKKDGFLMETYGEADILQYTGNT